MLHTLQRYRSFALLLIAAQVGCVDTPTRPQAFRIERQQDLIGGVGALGQVGDYMLRNGKVRVIIQDVGFSRGFAVYGGSLIDADIRRPRESGDARGGNGNDRFGELFPAFFLEAAEPTRISVRNDGSDGKPARVVVNAKPGPFLTLVNLLNDVAIGPEDVTFSIEYSLGPDDRFVTIKSTLRNVSKGSRAFPKANVGVDLPVPIGHIALLGGTNRTFVPGLGGFDLRFTLPEINNANPRTLPALPGLVAEFVASQNDGVSYGVFTESNEANNFAWKHRDQYGPTTTPASLQVPFTFSSFLGYYYSQVPPVLGPDEAFTATSYFAVGRGDVADIRDIVQEFHKTPVGRFSGRVLERDTQAPLNDLFLVVTDAAGNFVNQHTTNAQGDFTGTLPPGDYAYQVVSNRYPLEPKTPFSITKDASTFVDVKVGPTAFLNVQVTEPNFGPIPAKIVLEGTHDFVPGDLPTHKFLFDLKSGERRRIADQVPDTADPATRKYLEGTYFTADGRFGERVRPGKYTLYVSRGIEYEVVQRNIELAAGKITEVAVSLPRAFKTENWMSGDYHLHSSNSIDASTSLRDRVLGCAGEGVEIAVATDHNFIADYAPVIQDLNLHQFMTSMVGLEMTTLELGHFNGYPLSLNLAEANRGSFTWFNRPAQEIFDNIRQIGKYGPADTIVQVNHPRDAIQGYFNQLNVSADTALLESNSDLLQPKGEPFLPSSFSLDFDAIEVFNGKRFEMLRTLRAPDPLPPNSPANARPGETIRNPDDNRVAFPGAVDDWFHFLNLGQRWTGMANSDSHANNNEECGYPRTYVKTTTDQPVAVSDLEVARAIKRHETIMTNGPFVELSVSGTGIGGEVKGTTHTVKTRIRKASWVHIDRLNLWVNGVLQQSTLLSNAADETIETPLTVSRDSWIVAEVTGSQKSLWPIVTPIEEPPITVLDAVGDLGKSFGLEGSPLGGLTPKITNPVFPYALTNPIWIDADSNGSWTPLENPPYVAPVRHSEAFKGSAPTDLRVLFRSLHPHD